MVSSRDIKKFPLPIGERGRVRGGKVMSKLMVWVVSIIGSVLYFYFLDLLIMKAYFGASLGLNLFPK